MWAVLPMKGSVCGDPAYGFTYENQWETLRVTRCPAGFAFDVDDGGNRAVIDVPTADLDEIITHLQALRDQLESQ